MSNKALRTFSLQVQGARIRKAARAESRLAAFIAGREAIWARLAAPVTYSWGWFLLILLGEFLIVSGLFYILGSFLYVKKEF